jgi:hypothetical protein
MAREKQRTHRFRNALVVLVALFIANAYLGIVDVGKLVARFSNNGNEANANVTLPLVATASSQQELTTVVQQMFANGTLTTKELCKKRIDGHLVGPRADLLSGELYYKAIAFLQEATNAGFTVEVSCAVTGHSEDEFLHPRSKAIDISAINGQSVEPDGSQTKTFGRWLSDWQKPLADRRPLNTLPYEIGGPAGAIDVDRLKQAGDDREGPFFTDSSHQDHFHIGFECLPSESDDFGDCFSNESRTSLRAAYKVAPWK